MYNSIREILGICLIFTSLFDAWKYVWQAKKIIKIKTAKGHSRKFLNVAIFNDILKLLYGIFIKDIFIIFSSFLALITMSYNYITIYNYYPYRMRGRPHFKKPNLLLYIINSILPNRIRKKL